MASWRSIAPTTHVPPGQSRGASYRLTARGSEYLERAEREVPACNTDHHQADARHSARTWQSSNQESLS